jgi:hypothetical protein
VKKIKEFRKKIFSHCSVGAEPMFAKGFLLRFHRNAMDQVRRVNGVSMELDVMVLLRQVSQ